MLKFSRDRMFMWLWLAAWILVCGTGLVLRMNELGKRPMHADEATGAKITADRMTGVGGRFDPSHFHGPLLGDLSAPLCRLRGETDWQSMSSTTLRLLPAIAGMLLCFAPCWICRDAGRWPPWLAAGCLATSPMLVFYSRMFIHEMLLTLFGAAALAAARSSRRWWLHVLPGAAIGAMFATKETVAISLISWGVAAATVVPRHWLQPSGMRSALREHLPLLLTNAAMACTLAAWCYSAGGTHPAGIVDAVKTFFVYQTGGGHEKPASYYLELLVMPHRSLGFWWTEAPVLILAVVGWLRLEWNASAHHLPFVSESSSRHVARLTARFLGVSACIHVFIYSVISYKTPWLMCLPWAHVCLLAGYATASPVGLASPAKALKVRASAFLAALCMILVFAFQSSQAWLASFRFPTNGRNRLAYVPTREDLASLHGWLRELADLVADRPGDSFNIAVIGSSYWPLPWYLRDFPRVGYWPAPVPQLARFSVVLATPEVAEAASSLLHATHVMVPRGLRDGVSIQVGIRRDDWELWMKTPSKTPPR